MVKDNSEQVKVIYPQKAVEVGGELQNVNDTDASLDEIINANKESTNKWSKYPVDVSPSQPYGFMAVRSRSNGVWGLFKVAQYSKWSYDSRLITKFTVTSTFENHNQLEQKQILVSIGQILMNRNLLVIYG